MEEIEANGIKIYALPDCDSDEDEFYKEKVCTHFSMIVICSSSFETYMKISLSGEQLRKFTYHIFGLLNINLFPKLK